MRPEGREWFVERDKHAQRGTLCKCCTHFVPRQRVQHPGRPRRTSAQINFTALKHVAQSCEQVIHVQLGQLAIVPFQQYSLYTHS